MTSRAPAVLFAFALLCSAGAAAQQQPPAAASAAERSATKTQPPAEKPLNLRLDGIERRPTVTFTPRDDRKKDPAQDLPGLGGNPSKSVVNSDPTTVIPVTNDNIE